MDIYYISWREQELILEKLYRSTDAISSTRKFNEQYAAKLGKVGEKQMPLNDFCRKMKQTHFSDFYVERFTKEVTGQDVDLDTV